MLTRKMAKSQKVHIELLPMDAFNKEFLLISNQKWIKHTKQRGKKQQDRRKAENKDNSNYCNIISPLTYVRITPRRHIIHGRGEMNLEILLQRSGTRSVGH